MMTLQRHYTPLLPPIDVAAGNLHRHIQEVRPGDILVTWAHGTQLDEICTQALRAQASAIVCEHRPSVDYPSDRVHVVENARKAFALMSGVRHGMPPPQPLVGVTGTDGKTSVVHCISHCLGDQAASVGSLGMRCGVLYEDTGHTSPPSDVLHRFLAQLPPQCPGVAMEISSHAAHQERCAGLPLRGLAFTGLGHDHLDYHGSMRAYRDAKLQTVSLLAPGAWLVVNADDAHAVDFIRAARGITDTIVELGVRRGDALLRRREAGWSLLFAGQHYHLALPQAAAHQAWNAAAGALLAHACGIPLPQAFARIGSCPPVPGRLERLADNPITYVDYACTPEAVRRVVACLRQRYPQRRLVVVFGCGGNRDKGKRGPMGDAAAEADYAIITNDNPRDEDPQAIADAIRADMGQQPGERMSIILDRRQAIDHARVQAGHDGVVAVLGKGHETVQIIGDQRIAWSDRDYIAGLQGAVS
ncbi:MAG: UDP-N-acetylmuramoyl-L-alanyl-D-glutamate--2,6-diaminopimelate ligase [Planctomycetota bacterium]|nr:MAG: UDP-N-acetylmuramoyl-L-alanyl-D-glutamate--2,6-diaminopimelate ligase [Planctomycetota bacterium]